jgi:hypothetical protein
MGDIATHWSDARSQQEIEKLWGYSDFKLLRIAKRRARKYDYRYTSNQLDAVKAKEKSFWNGKVPPLWVRWKAERMARRGENTSSVKGHSNVGTYVP